MADAFIDNPTIAALGGALGLQPIFDAAHGADSGTPPPDPSASNTAPKAGVSPGIDPTAPTFQNVAPKAGASKPNVPAFRNRPYIPRQEQGTQGRGVRPGQGDNPITPGVMDPATLQSPQVQALLGSYGVTPSTAPPDPNLFIHNPQAFQNHPIISGLLERGLEGLAYAHPGSNFLDSLIGGVKGMQEANAARGAQVNAQMMAPVQQAMAIQQLQKGQDEHSASQSEMDYKKGMLEHYYNQDMTRSERLMALPPRYDPKTGQPSYATDDGKGNISYKPDPNWQENPHDAFVRQYYENAKAGLVQKYGSLDKVPQKDLLDAMSGIESAESVAKSAGPKSVKMAPKGGGAGTGVPTKMAPIDTKDWGDAESTVTKTQAELSRIDNMATTFTDEDGNLLTPKSSAAKAYRQKLQDRITTAETTKNTLRRKYGSTVGPASQPAAPQFSPGNPFAPKTK